MYSFKTKFHVILKQQKNMQMFYFYTMLVPFLITLLGYVSQKNRPVRVSEYLSFLSTILLIQLTYAFVILYLEAKDIIDVGWVSYTLFFFLAPISIIVFLLTFIYLVKK